MRLCRKCKHITAGKPLFCQHCGLTYDRRLCPKMHISPRAARVCAVCGSKELSTPHPALPFLLRPFALVWKLLFGYGLGGFLLCAIVVATGYFAYRLYEDPYSLLPSMCTIFVLGLAFFFWMMLPKPARGLMKKGFGLFFRRKRKEEHH